MSGFSSLLDQFKQITQHAAAAAAAVSSSSGSRSGGSSDATNKKRPRSIFESANVANGVPKRGSSVQSANGSGINGVNGKRQQQQQYKYPTAPVHTIYIACPAFAETGGPEALHQLCHVINTGEYSYGDSEEDDEDEVSDDKPGYDEFGRAITKGTSDVGGSATKTKKKKVVQAYMLYLREHNDNSVERIQSPRARSTKYDRYNAPPANVAPGTIFLDNNNNDEYSSEMVLWPECWTHLIDSFQPSAYGDNSGGAKKYQVAIWWLSVNNNKGRFLPHQFSVRKDILHLVQSAYARDYVSSKLNNGDKKGRLITGAKGEAKVVDNAKESGSSDSDRACRVMMLTEFLPYASPTFSPTPTTKPTTNEETTTATTQTREIDVVYNTAKGMHYTDEIIRRAAGKKHKMEEDGSVIGGGIKFAPIGKGRGGRERMTGEEVVALLRRSKVYIDFGPHPGMDRLPREAALAGCIVLTNREGAANFAKDVPLPEEFKFSKFDVDVIYGMLKDCCCKDDNHQKYVEKMKPYVKWILVQEKQMEVCVDRLVDSLVTRRVAKSNKSQR